MSIRSYVEKLTRGSGIRTRIADRAPDAGASHAGDSFEKFHATLGGKNAVDRSDPARASLLARLTLALGDMTAEQGPTSGAEGAHRLTMPPFNRTSMAPRRWSRKERDAGAAPPHARARPWIGLRRISLLCLIVGQTTLATHFMAEVLPYGGRQPLELAILALFAILFGWISAGFWTAMAGFVLLARGRDRHAITRTASPDAPIDPRARTAVVMPICNEDVSRVYAGLRATYESVEREGALDHFDFFVLSDTADPDTRVAETVAWKDLCRAVGGFGRIYYRWRQHRIKRKSGNVADFCRRWGRNYRYMVVLDADSVMSGACLAQLVRIMEANPDAGIVQTAPRAVGRDTLYARIQQFAAGVYGPVFTAGLNFWQLGESHYWGHNAIIRVAPFVRHCALARLPGSGSLSGEILSHDFVEAALMRRAGWGVWLAYDLPGSYEEMPPNLVNELARDRRWCHGNLMNFRLFLMRGLHPAHRAVFVIGVMAYLSAPLWFLALILSTVLLGVHTLTEPQYFVEPYQLFPVWPSWRPEWAVALFGTTAVLLFLPKILSVLLIAARGAATHGGRLRLGLSLLAEMAVSALLAPIRMLFHTQYVAAALSGLHIKWKSPPREDAETTWSEALSRHGWHTLLGLAWAALVYWLDPSFLWWLMPVAGAMMLSIPISVYTSRIGLGRKLRDAGYFAIPEELEPPPEMKATQHYTRVAPALKGFVDAVVDPLMNALVCASGAARPGVTREIRIARLRLVHDALIEGPQGLSVRQKTTLLNDPVALSQLHFQVWTYPDAHPDWRRAIGADAAEGNVVPLPRRAVEPRRVYANRPAAAQA